MPFDMTGLRIMEAESKIKPLSYRGQVIICIFLSLWRPV